MQTPDTPAIVIDVKDFQIDQKCIATGAWGTVHRAERIATKEIVAMKFFGYLLFCYYLNFMTRFHLQAMNHYLMTLCASYELTCIYSILFYCLNIDIVCSSEGIPSNIP
jgi:hypothetical protein